MSRSTLVRALLAAVSLLGAVPLMGQAAATVATVPAFPYGTYTSTQPADSNHPAARSLTVELTQGAMKVSEDGELISTYLISVSGRNLQLWRAAGRCADPRPILGNYTWSLSGAVLKFDLVDDPCPGRSEKVTATRLVQAPAPSPAATFPYGRYLIQPLPAGSQNGAGLIVEIGTSTAKVLSGSDLVETHGAAVDGDTWRIFEFTGECLDEGSYHWHFADGVLTFEIISDPCSQRATSVSTVRLVRQP